MAVKVSFFTPAGIGSVTAPGIGRVRKTETVALDAASAAAAAEGECALVFNGEASPIMAAHGTTPDAAAGTETAATSAGVPVPSGQSVVLVCAEGAKISVKALA